MDKYFTFKDRLGHYLDEGAGEAIIFVHGFAEDGDVWMQFRHSLEGYRHIVPDLPGYGKSEPARDEFTIEFLAEFLNAILEKEGIDKVHFVGHSMGGYTGLAFAKKYPGKLKGFTFFHSQPFPDSEEKKKERIRSVAIIEKFGTDVFIRELYYNLFAKKFLDAHIDFINSRVAAAKRIPAPVIQATLMAMANRVDQSGTLKAMKVPVLFIIGTEDKAIPYEISLKQLSLPSISEVNILEGCGHMGMYEKEEECRGILKRFFEFSKIF